MLLHQTDLALDRIEKGSARMEEHKKSKPTLRARANKVKFLRCKNLIAVIENPADLRNIGTIIRNVNALGAEQAGIPRRLAGYAQQGKAERRVSVRHQVELRQSVQQH